MPYIPAQDRAFVRANSPSTVGELNFKITELISGWFQDNGGKYQQVNDVLGALEGAKLEFYRRVAAPYEDKKIEENGDVY